MIHEISGGDNVYHLKSKVKIVAIVSWGAIFASPCVSDSQMIYTYRDIIVNAFRIFAYFHPLFSASVIPALYG